MHLLFSKTQIYPDKEEFLKTCVNSSKKQIITTLKNVVSFKRFPISPQINKINRIVMHEYLDQRQRENTENEIDQQAQTNLKQFQSQLKQLSFEEIAQYWRVSISSELDNYMWNFVNQEYQKQGVIYIVSYIDASKVQDVNFHRNQHSQILKQISHINFQRLSWLSLAKNQIVNIEPFIWMLIPEIKVIWLNSNHIKNLHCLSKCYWPKLRSFDFNRTFSKCINGFQRTLTSKKFSYLWFQTFYYEITLMQDISCILKLQVQLLSALKIETKRRIVQEKVLNCLRNKYSSLRQQKNANQSLQKQQSVQLQIFSFKNVENRGINF